MNSNYKYKNAFRILKGGKISLVVSALLTTTSLFSAPSGGVVTSGSATINQSGSVTNINQSSQKASINWNKFSIDKNETVNFNQPNVNSITLNRVVGNERSVINGALNANGQVWILNSNGVLFGKNASINTSGLLATTKNISDLDFQKGNYNFKGDSTSSIINQGTIDINNSGYVVFASNEVQNSGVIKAVKGNVHLVGAKEYSINLNGNSLVNLTVDKGVLDALVKNSGTIIADGGEVYLTTNAVDELLKGVVNNTGVIEANSIDDVTGKVELFAHGGKAEVGGTISATDGFVETSGKDFKILDDAIIKAGEWLIDPVDITIDDSLASTIETALGSGDVTIETTSAGASSVNTSSGESAGDGDITVNSGITWSTNKKLTLKADDEIYVNATIENTNNTNGGVYFQAANTSNKVIFDTNGKVIVNNVYQLQWINQALNGKYELGSNIDASVTKNWDSGKGFNPIGNNLEFTGSFDGLGHTIDSLYINRPNQNYVGLFGYTQNSTIKNIGLTNIDITGNYYVGGLVGYNGYSTISNSYASGSVTGSRDSVGGLVGYNDDSTISNSYASGSVSGDYYVGGLIGCNYDNSSISNSYASGSVSGYYYVGGLVGYNDTSTISNSYASGSVSSESGSFVGGLVGYNDNLSISNSYASGSVSGNYYVGGLIGYNYDNSSISNSYTSGSVSGNYYVGGLVGYNGYSTISNSYTSGSVSSESGSYVGGLVGENYGTITNSFWDIDTTGQTNSSGGGTGIHSSTDTIDAFTKSTYKDFDFTNTWFMIDGETRPFLRMEYSTNITNDHQLQLMAMDLTANYTLAKNITYTGSMWSSRGFNPIGDDSNMFTGGFDGLGHTIDSLYINRPNQNYVGLFGYTKNSTIKNIGLTKVEIKGKNNVGGLVGYNESNGEASTIFNSYTSGSVSGRGENLGGLLGYNYGVYSEINYSYSSANVIGEGSTNRTGGLVGWNHNGASIKNSYATGSVNAQDGVGGLLGSNEEDAIVENSYSIGSVHGTEGSIGGLIGWSDARTTNSYWDTQKSGQTNGIGTNKNNQTATGLTTAQMSYGQIFKDASWDIVVDSSVTSSIPILKYDSVNNKYVWAIAPLALNYTLSDKTRTYNGTQSLSNLYTTSSIFGESYSFLDGDYKFQVSGSDVSEYKNAGTYNNIKVASDSDFLTIKESGNTAGKLTITPKAITVLADNQTKVYGDANPNLTYSLATGSSLVGSDTLSSLVDGSLSTSATSTSGVGNNYVISTSNLSDVANDNYTVTFNDGKLTITPKAITVLADNQTKVYGDANPNLTYSLATGSSLVGSDTLSSLVDGSLSTSATSTSGVGNNYVISTSNLSDVANDNYTVTFNDGKLTITPKAITVLADNQTKVYGDANPNLTYSLATGSSLVGSDTLSSLVDGSLSTSATSTSGVGNNYVISTSNLSDVANDNYTVTFNDGKLTITPKAITVLADNQTKVYGDANPNLTYSLATGSSLVGSDTLSSLVDGSLSTSATSTSGVGNNYVISTSNLSDVANDNYTVTFNDGKLTITPKAITVLADNQTKVYGDANPNLTYSLATGSSLVGSDTLSSLVDGSLSTSATSTSGVGNNYVISTSNLSDVANDNYTVTFNDGKLTITPKAITVLADNQTKVYGDANPNLTYSLATGSSLVGSDTLSSLVDGSLSTSATSTSGVGNNYVISTSNLSDVANDNYTVTFNDGKLTITPKAITVLADNQTKVYGDANPNLTYSLATGSSLVGSDTLSSLVDGSLSTSATSTSGVGNNYVISTSNLSDVANDNYTVTFNDGKLTITPKAITVLADNQTKVYGDANPNLTYSLATGSSLVGSDTLSSLVDGSLSTSATSTSGVGNNYVISTSNLSDVANDNYTVTFNDGKLTITPKAITVLADNQTKVYGDANPNLTYSLATGSSLVGSDTLSSLVDGSLSTSATSTSGVGNNYVISTSNLSDVANDNYTVTFNDGKLTITPKAITVLADNQTKVYGDANPNLTYSLATGSSLVGSDTLSSLVDGSLSTSATSTSGVGNNYVISTSNLSDVANDNYTVTFNDGKLTITPKAITVLADNQTKVYGDANPNLTYSLATGSSLVGSDTLSSLVDGSLSTSATSTSGVGNNYVISTSNLSDVANDNYTVTFNDGKLTITPKAITVLADNQTKVYGDANPNLTYVATGLINEDTLSGSLSTDATSTSEVGIYDITQGNLANTNYDVSFTKGELTVLAKNEPINKVIAPIQNQTAVINQTLANNIINPMTSISSQFIVPQQNRSNVTAVETNNNKILVPLSQIKEQTGSSDVRIRLSDNSMITLVNNAINLPSGVEQEFYVNENK
ncbi:MAG: MBG domain-containing protein [Halarcobacter sp.]